MGGGCFQYDAGGSDGEQGAIADDALFVVAQNVVIYKGACVAGAVAQHVFETLLLVPAHVDDTVVDVYAGVVGFDGGVRLASLGVSPYHVVAEAQGDDLLVVKHVFYDHDAAVFTCKGSGVKVLFFLQGLEFGHTDADAELLAAVGTLKHQRLAILVFCLVKGGEIVTLWALYSFHPFFLYTHDCPNTLSLLLNVLSADWAEVSLS